MRKVIPIVVGLVVLLLGVVFASQGAGIIGGSSLMDNNSTFIYVGGLVAIIGVALVVYGSISKPRVSVSM